MNWSKVEHNCKALYQYQFINGNNPAERKILINLIATEFPDYSRIRIAYAVDRCLSTITEPMTPITFLTFVKGYIL